MIVFTLIKYVVIKEEVNNFDCYIASAYLTGMRTQIEYFIVVWKTYVNVFDITANHGFLYFPFTELVAFLFIRVSQFTEATVPYGG